MPIPLGILAAAGVRPAAAGSYEHIQTVILTGTTNTVTLTNLDQYASTFKHLQIRYVARGTNITGARPLILTFNGDSTNSYSSHDLFNNGSSVASSNTVSGIGIGGAYFGYIATAGNAAGNWGAGVCDILDAFSSSKNKTFRTLSGVTGTDAQIILNSGAFLKTNPISSISLRPSSGDLIAASRFSIYGLKASA